MCQLMLCIVVISVVLKLCFICRCSLWMWVCSVLLFGGLLFQIRYFIFCLWIMVGVVCIRYIRSLCEVGVSVMQCFCCYVCGECVFICRFFYVSMLLIWWFCVCCIRVLICVFSFFSEKGLIRQLFVFRVRFCMWFLIGLCVVSIRIGIGFWNFWCSFWYSVMLFRCGSIRFSRMVLQLCCVVWCSLLVLLWVLFRMQFSGLKKVYRLVISLGLFLMISRWVMVCVFVCG